jgi:hypothetical protein
VQWPYQIFEAVTGISHFVTVDSRQADVENHYVGLEGVGQV